MAGELFAFYSEFDHAFVIRHDLQQILHMRLGLPILMYGKHLFYFITSAHHTSENRLMVDISAVQESYNR